MQIKLYLNLKKLSPTKATLFFSIEFLFLLVGYLWMFGSLKLTTWKKNSQFSTLFFKKFAYQAILCNKITMTEETRLKTVFDLHLQLYRDTLDFHNIPFIKIKGFYPNCHILAGHFHFS